LIIIIGGVINDTNYNNQHHHNRGIMSQALIYSPAKSAMQSGTAKTGHWVLEFKQTLPQNNNPLMGWAGGTETQTQISLKFDTLETAIAYAEQNHITFTIRKPKHRALRMKSYNENYAFDRRETWSH
jgi:hypothetical protein